MNFNPFSHLIETKLHPHARTLRTSFFLKVVDTFKTFSGGNASKHHNSDYSVRAGIFDYLTLGIFIGISYGFHRASELSSSLALQLTILGLDLICKLPKLIFSLVMTAASLPFIAIAHGITSLIANQDKQTIHNHKLSNHNGAQTKNSSTKYTFGELLKEKGCKLEDIKNIVASDHSVKPDTQTIKITYRFLSSENNDGIETSEQTDLFTECKTNGNFFNALKALNIGGIQSNIETKQSMLAQR